jgi:hypothetical protein
MWQVVDEAPGRELVWILRRFFRPLQGRLRSTSVHPGVPAACEQVRQPVPGLPRRLRTLSAYHAQHRGRIARRWRVNWAAEGFSTRKIALSREASARPHHRRHVGREWSGRRRLVDPRLNATPPAVAILDAAGSISDNGLSPVICDHFPAARTRNLPSADRA